MLRTAFKSSAIARNAVNSSSVINNSIMRPAPTQLQSVRFFALPKPKKDDGLAKVKTKHVVSKTKADHKKKNEGNRTDTREADGLYKFLHAAEDAKRVKLTFTDEELATNKAIAREYQSQYAKYHAAVHKDCALKLRLIKDALKAMPPHLREQAEIIDKTMPPQDRPWARYDTPPIKDFNPMDYVEKKKK